MLNINSAISASLIAASAALGAALFAFIAALINAKTARKNAVLQALVQQRVKRADFRQAWINDLRAAFAKTQVGFMADSLDKEGAENGIRVLLMMNRNDPDYDKLKSTIALLSSKDDIDPEEMHQARRDIIVVSQDIMKREWGVVKAELNHLEELNQESLR